MRNTYKPLYYLLLSVMATPAFAGNVSKDSSVDKPNILFILSDDHTAQAWGIYGGVLADYVQNQHIRRLASEGTVLDNCFCTNSISVPTRATILTGQYSHRNGVYTLDEHSLRMKEIIKTNFN